MISTQGVFILGVGLGLAFPFGHNLLNLDFNNVSDLGAQTGLASSGTLYDNLRASSLFPGSADFGTNAAMRSPTVRG
jgi:hypothetical protein